MEAEVRRWMLWERDGRGGVRKGLVGGRGGGRGGGRESENICFMSNYPTSHRGLAL